MRVNADSNSGGASVASDERDAPGQSGDGSDRVDADLPSHARRRRDVAIPWGGDAEPAGESQPPGANAPSDDPAPVRNGHASARGGAAFRRESTGGASSDERSEGAVPQAVGQWFVDAPTAQADPRAPAPPGGEADLDEFDHFGDDSSDDLEVGAYLDDSPSDVGFADDDLIDEQVDSDDGGHLDARYFDDGYLGEGADGEGVEESWAAGGDEPDYSYGAEKVHGPGEPESEGPPLTPLEARLARREAKLSYRGGRVEPVYDVSGPKVRLGVLWFLLACAGIALGPLGVGAVFVTAATVASLQVAAHLMIEEDTNSRVTAAVITAAVGTSAIFDARVVGIVILVSVVAAFIVASQTIDANMTVHVAGLTLRASLPLGIAVAAMLYLHRIDAWVFMILFGVVSLYDAGNFLVGTGSRRIWVGPLAGIFGALTVVFGAAGFEAPPLTEKTTWLLGGLAALSAPLGQIVGSFMLPRPDAKAPALRRLDTYLIAAPLMLALFLAIGGNRPLL